MSEIFQQNSIAREHIIKVASKLFLKKSFDRTSTRDIASACGIAMGTLYHHVGKKEDLLRLVVEHHGGKTRELVERLRELSDKENSIDSLAEALDIHLQAIEKDKNIFVFVFTEAKVMPPSIRSIFLKT